MDDDMHFRIVIERDALTIQPIRLGRTLTIGTYELCRTTSTEYIFSNDCATDRQQYIQDWLKTTNPSSAPPVLLTHTTVLCSMGFL